jgi:thiol-disulfide isomerase/thioredoxin
MKKAIDTLRKASVFSLLPLWLAACGDLPEEELVSGAVDSHGPEIAWFGGTIEEAFDLARNTARPVFLYWGAEWCPPCHYLKNKIFKRPEFVAKIAEFVPVYLDGDSERAQVLGEELDVQGYPTVIVFNPEGEEVIRMPSTIPVARYADILDAALQIRRPIQETLSRVPRPTGQNPAACAHPVRSLSRRRGGFPTPALSGLPRLLTLAALLLASLHRPRRLPDSTLCFAIRQRP